MLLYSLRAGGRFLPSGVHQNGTLSTAEPPMITVMAYLFLYDHLCVQWIKSESQSTFLAVSLIFVFILEPDHLTLYVVINMLTTDLPNKNSTDNSFGIISLNVSLLSLTGIHYCLLEISTAPCRKMDIMSAPPIFAGYMVDSKDDNTLMRHSFMPYYAGLISRF